MTELHFRTDLYAVQAVQAAMDAFSSVAEMRRTEQQGEVVVSLTAQESDDEGVLAGEFANYVLGATVDGSAS